MFIRAALFAIYAGHLASPVLAAECSRNGNAAFVGTIGDTAERNTFAFPCSEPSQSASEQYTLNKGDPVASFGAATGDPEKDTYAYRHR